MISITATQSLLVLVVLKVIDEANAKAIQADIDPKRKIPQRR